ncbi:MAG: GrpB family protein [Acidimicrobiia bacterium]
MDDARPARPTDGSVEVVEYRAEWPTMFHAERVLLDEHLPHVFVRIEHIGSTAVPGMPSKPTIDIAGAVRSLDDVLGELDSLYALGYDYRGFFEGVAEHLFLRKVAGGKRTHHLHVVTLDSAEITSWLAFRDFLRADPTAAADYAQAKRDLFARFPDDRMAYVDGKGSVVDALLARMRGVP